MGSNSVSISIRGITVTKLIVTVIISISSESYFPRLREYCPRAFGTWAIFPQLRDLDASHYLHIINLTYLVEKKKTQKTN